ncbi:MAG: hypothetical protein KGH79_02610 [Patescibacteria group bacterium]|nr:hypothetical protein [Patescibacteria group bacterium]
MMSQGYWILVTQLNELTRVKPHWMDSADFERLDIRGNIGEEYQLDEDDPESKYRIVGEIKGKAAEVLNTVVEMIDLVEGSTTTSQELRFNIIAELVQDVVGAVERAQKQ